MLGDLGEMSDARTRRQALRGVKTVIHLAAAIRDQPGAKVEELNGLATARLLRAAEQAGVERFIFFSAIGATEFQRTRFFRAKALAEEAVASSELPSTDLRPFDRLRPRGPLGHAHPPPGALPRPAADRHADAAFSPSGRRTSGAASSPSSTGGDRRPPLRARGPRAPHLRGDEPRHRLVDRPPPTRPSTCPPNLVRLGLNGVRRIAGDAAFATWEEAELLEVPMVSERGTADAERVGRGARGAWPTSWPADGAYGKEKARRERRALERLSGVRIDPDPAPTFSARKRWLHHAAHVRHAAAHSRRRPPRASQPRCTPW